MDLDLVRFIGGGGSSQTNPRALCWITGRDKRVSVVRSLTILRPAAPTNWFTTSQLPYTCLCPIPCTGIKMELFMRIPFLVSVACVLFAGTACAQFPDLPGKDLTLRACGNCHEAERASSLRQDRDAWDATMTSMAGRGMAISDADYNTVLDYLAKAFPAPPPKPLNINTASAIDMETTLSLLRSQAALIIAYREKHGNFKSVEDLKKVSGLDFSKIEDKKDRIAF